MEKFKTLEILQKTPNSCIFHLYLNRPSHCNALSHDFFSEFPKALAFLNQNPDVNVVILSGIGNHFCARINLGTVGSISENSDSNDREHGREKLWRHIKYLQDAVTAIKLCRKPMIVSIQGVCIGGGIDIATTYGEGLVKVRHKLKSRNKDQVKAASDYARTIDDFDNLIDSQTLYHHFLCLEPSTFVLRAIEKKEKMLGEMIHITIEYLTNKERVVMANFEVEVLEAKISKLRKDLITAMDNVNKKKEQVRP
ncbi:delta(3,5)-Delta(2,4)-dienoyl-CoA isomerase, peroxisomal-like [Quercus robur]|uniref:delta(3,5)-Delta(2,4)-dienoyl-CoA isomerase, peroxisomal-like n=1 Tax=Quercus robur TaxID=38942 RepID=UPI0021618BD5|nr:delta(3,5)-Delta(2,4)-dienoyl-CoA isomerase, peroxisomal-like [Quercus robur]